MLISLLIHFFFSGKDTFLTIFALFDHLSLLVNLKPLSAAHTFYNFNEFMY